MTCTVGYTVFIIKMQPSISYVCKLGFERGGITCLDLAFERGGIVSKIWLRGGGYS